MTEDDHTSAALPYSPLISDEYDGPLLPLANLINIIGDQDPTQIDAVDTITGVRTSILELEFESPVEFRLRLRANGELDVRAGPPTQHMETTVFPVLHHMKVHLVRSDATDLASGAEGKPNHV